MMEQLAITRAVINAGCKMTHDRGRASVQTIRLRDLLCKFAMTMESKLQDNDSKPHWRDEGLKTLIAHFKEEVTEFLEAIDNGRPTPTIMGEACDVALTAMMVVDIVSVINRDTLK